MAYVLGVDVGGRTDRPCRQRRGGPGRAAGAERDPIVACRLRDHLDILERELRMRQLAGPLLVMQSNGGAVAAAEASANAISTVGSVLTGGVIGSLQRSLHPARLLRRRGPQHACVHHRRALPHR